MHSSKTEYTVPELEIVEFRLTDVILGSPIDDDPFQGEILGGSGGSSDRALSPDLDEL